MNTQNLAYIRVSTIEQNTQRQRVAFKNQKIDRYFEEKVSAKNTKRPQLQELMQYAREGDTIYVVDLSRLARSTKDLLEIIESLIVRKINLVSLKESLELDTPAGRMMITMLGAIYESERANILERQKEGIAIAKVKGKFKGRKKIEKPENWDDVYFKWKNRELKSAEAIKLLGLKESTFYRLIKEIV